MGKIPMPERGYGELTMEEINQLQRGIETDIRVAMDRTFDEGEITRLLSQPLYNPAVLSPAPQRTRLRLPSDDGARQKPMVSRADYDKARVVLNALPPGLYIKCFGCEGWYRSRSITFEGTNVVLCEECSR